MGTEVGVCHGSRARSPEAVVQQPPAELPASCSGVAPQASSGDTESMNLESVRDAIVQRLPQPVRRVARFLRSGRERRNVRHEWRRARAGAPALAPQTRRVIVICFGNICRSPFAGELLAARRPDLEVRSAGLEARDGKPAEAGAQRVAQRHGIDLSRHGAHRLREEDVAWADVILAMEGYQCDEVRARWPGYDTQVVLLGDFFADAPFLIEDPYGQTDDVFATAFERIVAATARFEAALPKQGASSGVNGSAPW